MPTIYAAQNNWPVQQSLNEVKHKSGLFAATATFIRPVGNAEIPETIETSIGNVNVWPDPVVSTGTDGFQTITATGYGVWDETLVDSSKNYTPGFIELTAESFVLKEDPNSPGVPASPLVESNRVSYYKKINVIFETGFIKKIGDQIPAAPSLRILDYNNEDITANIFDVNALIPNAQFFNYQQGVAERGIPTSLVISHSKLNTYGTIYEIETAFEIIALPVNFGTWIGLIQ